MKIKFAIFMLLLLGMLTLAIFNDVAAYIPPQADEVDVVCFDLHGGVAPARMCRIVDDQVGVICYSQAGAGLDCIRKGGR